MQFPLVYELQKKAILLMEEIREKKNRPEVFKLDININKHPTVPRACN